MPMTLDDSLGQVILHPNQWAHRLHRMILDGKVPLNDFDEGEFMMLRTGSTICSSRLDVH